ncbi:MAG: hypothetical protein QM578_03220 [Pantoea sp.]|uniref:hypothetical protein n=1 Tax=Pantoea sp. TaxID=69393 RepID=UPI0039E6579B
MDKRILAEAWEEGILICYTNYYRANYMGIYGNFSRHFHPTTDYSECRKTRNKVISDRKSLFIGYICALLWW